jgi:hypothetical protein
MDGLELDAPSDHKESALQGRVAQPKRTFGTKVPAYEDAAVSYSTFNFLLSTFSFLASSLSTRAGGTKPRTQT